MRVWIPVLAATGFAVALLFVIPFASLAQTAPSGLEKLRPDKRAVIEREAREIAAARVAPRPPKNQVKLPRAQRLAPPFATRPNGQTVNSSIPHRAAGQGTIVDSGLAPFPASSFTFENRWFEHTAAGDLVVYAGASHDDPTQGVLVVRQVGQKLGPATAYRTPTHNGSVRIISAEGKKLSLMSSSGAHLSFDTTSRTFGP